MFKITLKPRAIEMMQQAYDWYETQRIGLGEDFLVVLDIALGKLASHPEYYHISQEHYRQIKLSRFPYVIIYEIFEKK